MSRKLLLDPERNWDEYMRIFVGNKRTEYHLALEMMDLTTQSVDSAKDQIPDGFDVFFGRDD